jgi:hypothetical protein
VAEVEPTARGHAMMSVRDQIKVVGQWPHQDAIKRDAAADRGDDGIETDQRKLVRRQQAIQRNEAQAAFVGVTALYRPARFCSTAAFDLSHQRHGEDAVLIAFDLIELDGEDLRRSPIDHRKRKLAKLVRSPHPGNCVERGFRRGRSHPLRARLQAWLRGYRVEAARPALPLRALAPLAQDQKSESTSGDPGG